jgi:hypothetical protein
MEPNHFTWCALRQIYQVPHHLGKLASLNNHALYATSKGCPQPKTMMFILRHGACHP